MPVRRRFVFLVLSCLALPQAGFAADQVLTGEAAYGDTTTSEPGTVRHIRPSDLPQPYATRSVRNSAGSSSGDGGLQVPQGFTVTPFAERLSTPRQMRVAPNGDVFLAESGGRRISVLRAAPGAPKATVSVFAEGLSQRPYGIGFWPLGNDPQFVYVATEGQVIRFPYKNGDLKASGPGQVVVPNLPAGGHWTRDVTFSKDGSKMLVAVGSASNVAESGMANERRRADILEFNPDGSGEEVFASGIRNPVSLVVHPVTGDLWTSVNERDLLGDNLPPDYVTRVERGGFYGWPWFYIGNNPDPRHKDAPADLKGKVKVPDVLIQPHSAPLGLTIYQGTAFPVEYRGNLFVGLHGSWNRSQRTGYKVVRIPLKDGKPDGTYVDFMTGFVSKGGDVRGRPVGVTAAADGSLLVSDDGAGTVWRVTFNR